MKDVPSLRNVTSGDLLIFFEQQLDSAANQMAAFTAKDNAGSRRVLEKNDFQIIAESRRNANARGGEEIEELLLSRTTI